jgi:hypothetical protein
MTVEGWERTVGDAGISAEADGIDADPVPNKRNPSAWQCGEK